MSRLCNALIGALITTWGFGAPIAGTAGAAEPDVYTAALANPARSAADRERDARDRPAEVLALAGIKSGMVVADIFGGGGYWSEILTGVVGVEGSVLLVNNPPYVEFAKKELDARFGGGRLASVKQRVVDAKALGLGSGALDAAIIVLSYHDLYHVDEKGGWPAIDAAQFLEQIRSAVKPGGVFVVIDHAAQDGTGSAAAQELHRIEEAFAERDIESHGFELETRWDGLRNAADDHSKLVFDPAVRGKTDRFTHVYRRK